MSKRFVDTDKYRKGFVKGLPLVYKVFWDYICLECNHAGIWEVETDVAAVRIGAKINAKEALDMFNQDEIRIREISDGRKWLILPFMTFQYGEGSRAPAFLSACVLLEKEGIKYPFETLPEQLPKTSQSLMDMDKDMDMDKNKDKNKNKIGNTTKAINNNSNIVLPDWLDAKTWADFVEMRTKIKHPMTARAKELMIGKLDKLRQKGYDAKALMEKSILNGWRDIYEPKGHESITPFPAPTLPAVAVCKVIAYYGTQKQPDALKTKPEQEKYILNNPALVSIASDLLALCDGDSNKAMDYLAQYNDRMIAKGRPDWALSWAVKEAKEMGVC